jgi:hypothetical protein
MVEKGSETLIFHGDMERTLILAGISILKVDEFYARRSN